MTTTTELVGTALATLALIAASGWITNVIGPFGSWIIRTTGRKR